jgi:hypothetical protein
MQSYYLRRWVSAQRKVERTFTQRSLRIFDVLAIVLVVLCCVHASQARADETCGLKNVVYDAIFIDGFQGVQDNGFGPALGTVPVPTFGTTPTVAITYPAGGANFSVGQTSVVGTYTGPAVTGVSVDGTPAYTMSGNFVVPITSLASGSNTLTATVTTLDGLTSTAQVMVSYAAGSPDLTLVPDRAVGPVPFSIGYVLTIPFTYHSFSFDFGDGSPAYTGSPDSIPRHTYATAGIYAAQATAVDALNVTHQVSVKVGIYVVAQLRAQLCSVYAYLRSRLNANDSTGALQAFSLIGQDRYHDFFIAGTTNLPNVGASLGTLAGGLLAPTYAEMMALIDQAGVIQATPVQFVLGSDGVWRIESM